MSECTRNGGSRLITQLAHNRRRLGKAERTSPLGMYHDLAASGELVNAVTVLAAEIHERPFAIRLNLGKIWLHQLSPAQTASSEFWLKGSGRWAIR